ncbi:hypothetical protein ACUXV3_16880 [Roseobacteraceae bacterium NS-SX3]
MRAEIWKIAGIFKGLKCLTPAVLGIALLLLQLLAPAALRASAAGQWIEICAGGGTELVRVGTGGAGDNEPCPDCSQCALCAPMDAAGPPRAGAASQHLMRQACLSVRRGQTRTAGAACTWPETRGPPAAGTHITIARAWRALMAETFETGGAPWQ